MIDRIVVQNALKQSLAFDSNRKWMADYPIINQDSVISLLVYDIFGGDILKTPLKKGWHFYNRIEGECIDFTSSDIEKPPEGFNKEDLPSSPEEISNYFEPEEYSTFLIRFIWAYEEAIGLDKYRNIATA